MPAPADLSGGTQPGLPQLPEGRGILPCPQPSDGPVPVPWHTNVPVGLQVHAAVLVTMAMGLSSPQSPCATAATTGNVPRRLFGGS